VNPLAGLSGLARWFSTHPPMRERIERLRAMAHGRWAA
jgi:Zn-dependent protease with chaperone function